MIDIRNAKNPLLGFVAVAALLLAACTTGEQSTAPTATDQAGSEEPDTSAPPSANEDLGVIRIGFGTSPLDLTAQHFVYGQEQGFFANRGLEVEILPFAGDQTSLRAIATGEVDVLWTGCAPAMIAMEVGAPIVVISATTPKLDYELVTTTEITRPREIEGHSLGVSQPGAVSYQVPNLMISGDGGNFENVEVVSVGGSSARVQALIAGTIDAAVLNSSFAERTRQYDNLHTIAIAADTIPDFIYACEVATRETVAERPEALQALIEGALEAAAWAEENPEEAAEISQTVLPDVPMEEILAGTRNFAEIGYHNLSGTLSQQAWDFTAQQLVEGGDLSEALAYDEYVLTELSDAAAAALGY